MAEAGMGDWEKIQPTDLDECARHEVIHGCELAKQLEMKLNSTPVSGLYELLLHSSTEIVTSFSKALDLLSSTSNPNSVDWRGGFRVLLEKQIGEGLAGSGHSQTIPVKDNRNSSPRSGARSSVSGSPPSDRSEGSPVHNLMAISGKLKCGEPGDSSENNPANCKERREISRKRKSLPRWTTRIAASNSEPGNDIPPDDGHTWRKYGQKDILGAHHPRSYYRCTHKNDLGCQATKQVQRADDDPSFFEITYRGVHSCQIDPRLVQIQLPFAISQIGSNTNPNSNLSRTLVFGADCNLQSNTTTDQGLHPTHFNSSSRQSSMSRFGSDSGGACKVENENFDVFGKSQVSTMFPYSPNLAHIRPPEGNTANTALQPNRHSKISVSLFRKQASEGENFTDFFPQQHNECVAFSEGELGVSNFAQIFGSPATSDSNYITLPPAMPFMNLNERVNTHGQPLQTSESDLTEVISGHTSAADSPMLDMDMMFNTVNLDSLFQFERSEPF